MQHDENNMTEVIERRENDPNFPLSRRDEVQIEMLPSLSDYLLYFGCLVE